MTTHPLLTTRQAAARLNITRQAVLKRIEAGTLRPHATIQREGDFRPSFLFTEAEIRRVAELDAAARALPVGEVIIAPRRATTAVARRQLAVELAKVDEHFAACEQAEAVTA